MTNHEETNILLVDDRPDNLLALESLLEDGEFNIIKAASGNEALERMLEYHFAVVLLDVQMPDMDGFETAELMRGSEKTKRVPIIFVTAINKEQKHVFKGYEAGAVDYLSKPIEPEILISKVNVFVELDLQRKAADGAKNKLEQTVKQLEEANKTILRQQDKIVEEERLKVLLQMAGATAHELNQPLTSLLGAVELIRLEASDHESLDSLLEMIEESGQRISDIVKRIQTIRHDKTIPYINQTRIIDINQGVKILSVEDSNEDYEKLAEVVSQNEKLVLDRAKNIAEAVDKLKHGKFDLVFMDYVLPDGTGRELLNTIAAEGINIPAVVITGQGDEIIASRMIQAGAYDYLPKDKISTHALSRIINNTLDKSRLRNEIITAQKKIADMSARDELTGLYNHRYFMESLESETSRAHRYQTGLVLGMIDLDFFKRVNDTYGHSVGDSVLRRIGAMLKEHLRNSDIVCRYGGEEFAVIFPNTKIDQSRIVCERFAETMAAYTFEYNSSSFSVTVSMGLAALTHKPATTLSQLLEMADQSLYKAKDTGRNKIVLWETT